MNRFLASVTLLTAILSTTTLNATHLRCGQIQIDQIGGAGSLTVIVTVQVYTNTNYTSVLFGGEQDYLFFGDGSMMLVPEIGPGDPRYTMINHWTGLAMAEFSVQHTYASFGQYIVSYNEPNRNEGILNFTNSVNTRFYLESLITLAPDQEYSSPHFLSEPFFKKPRGPYAISLAATDENDYSLIYSLVVPKMDKLANVEGYIFPGDVNVNAFNGLLTWNGLFGNQEVIGEYLFAAKVSQFDDSELIGYVIRDIQVILTDEEVGINVSDDFEANQNRSFHLEPNETKTIKFWASQEAGYQTEFSIFSELTDGYTVETYDSLNGAIKVGVLTVTNSPELDRRNPYIISVRASKRGAQQDAIYFIDFNYTFYTREDELTMPDLSQQPETEEEIWMWPNPTGGFLNIYGYPLDNLSLRLVTPQGQVLMDVPELDKTQLDISLASTGIYIVQLWQNGRIVFTQKIVKAE
jgi:hypothetical protein